MNISRKSFCLILLALVVVLMAMGAGCSGSGGTDSSNSLTDCERAVRDAAAISDSQDSVEDLDPAIRRCSTMSEFSAATRLFPGALDAGVDARTFVTNRCTYNSSLGSTALCRSLN